MNTEEKGLLYIPYFFIINKIKLPESFDKICINQKIKKMTQFVGYPTEIKCFEEEKTLNVLPSKITMCKNPQKQHLLKIKQSVKQAKHQIRRTNWEAMRKPE